MQNSLNFIGMGTYPCQFLMLRSQQQLEKQSLRDGIPKQNKTAQIGSTQFVYYFSMPFQPLQNLGHLQIVLNKTLSY